MAGIKPDMTQVKTSGQATASTGSNSQIKALNIDDPITESENRRTSLLASQNPQIMQYQPQLRVAFVVVTNGICRAKNEHGELIRMSYIDCLSYSDAVNMSPKRQDNSNSDERRDDTQNQTSTV